LTDQFLIESVQTDLQETSETSFDVIIHVIIDSFSEGTYPMDATIAGAHQEGSVAVHEGRNRVTFHLSCQHIERWWPHGEGKQPLYPLTLHLGDQTVDKRIGFRTIKVNTEGGGVTFLVNGRPIYAKGANWIPLDAIPSRITPQRYEYLLESAVQANCTCFVCGAAGSLSMTPSMICVTRRPVDLARPDVRLLHVSIRRRVPFLGGSGTSLPDPTLGRSPIHRAVVRQQRGSRGDQLVRGIPEEPGPVRHRL
jgi:hypothetical protein